MPVSTNVFPITGLSGLSVSYDVYKIIGPTPGTAGYHGNIQTLINRLSRIMKAPITTLDRNGTPHIVVPADCDAPPIVPLVGVAASFVATGETLDIRFDERDDGLDQIRQRFLQFSIQSPIRDQGGLWQPKSGQAFFPKKPHRNVDGLNVFRGASLRIVPLANDGWGVCVEIKTKLVRKSPLSEKLDAARVKKLKGRSCLYQFGERWFEVTLDGLAEFNISLPLIPEDGETLSILDYVVRHARKPVSDRVANLNPNGAAIYYRTEGPTPKHAPAALCFLIEDTRSKDGARHQRESILPPHIREQWAKEFVKRHLARFSLRNVELCVSETPVGNTRKSFELPRFEFGNGNVVAFGSRKEGSGTRPLNELGRHRTRLMQDREVGFFAASALGRQYIVLPKSIASSSGPAFIQALKQSVNALYPAGGNYDPILIEYDDLADRSFVGQGKAIKSALQAKGRSLIAGHALVMIHRVHKRSRDSDPLEALVVKDFPVEFGLNASVIHTDKVKSVYRYRERDGQSDYVVHDKAKNALRSYLHNVALSKILIANGKVPFVLATDTHGDVFVGIDVKDNTAAFSLIADGGRIRHSLTWKSRKKEKLTSEQVSAYFLELLGLEKGSFDLPPREIVVHRDGRLFESEESGLHDACETLAEAGVIASDWQLTILEIKKTGPVGLRFFDEELTQKGRRTVNPLVGTWQDLTDEEGFICTTGAPFRRQGTASPLHVIRKAGEMPIETCLRDVFYLSCLSWTSPEAGIREPITIKLCDRVLFEDAAEYDEDGFFHSVTGDGVAS